MKLYDCTLAPNPRRVRIFLAEKGIEIEKVQVDIVKGENLRPEFLNINPRGLLPVLELDDGTRIDETIAICRYLEEIRPEPALLGSDALSKAVIESWQRHVEIDGFLAAAEAFRNDNPIFSQRAIPGVTERVDAIPALVARGRASTLRFFDRLNHRLASCSFVAGDTFSIADITALCTVDFARWAKLEVPVEHTHTRRWYETVSKRPSASA